MAHYKINKMMLLTIFVFLCLLLIMDVSCKKEEGAKHIERGQKDLQAKAKSEYISAISYYPKGKLGMHTPENISIFFPVRYDVAANSTVSYNQSKKCLSISPNIKGTIIWKERNQLEYRFEDIMLPETEYKVSLTCIPFQDRQEKINEKISFSFITPPVQLISGYIKVWGKNELQSIIRWNYPLSESEIADYIDIYDAEGEEVKAKSIVVYPGDPNSVEITLKNTSSEYSFEFKAGMPIKNNKATLKEGIEYNLSAPTGNLYLSGLSVIEGSDNYVISLHCNSGGSKYCLFDVDKIASYIRLEPSIPFTIASYGNIIEIHANFEFEKTYNLYISAGLITTDGYQLYHDYHQSITIPKPLAKLAFAIQGLYLGKKGGTKLPLKVRNIKKIAISISRMPKENIPYWYFDKNESSWGFKRLSEKIVKEKIINVDVGNETKLYWLDLRDFINIEETGIYEIVGKEVSPKKNKDQDYNEYDEYYEEDDYYDNYFSNSKVATKTLVIISDISIIAKRASDSIYIWALNSSTLVPENNVKAKLLSDKNIVMGACTTNSDGVCKLSFRNDYDRTPYILTAIKDNNFSFIYFNSSTLSTHEFDVSGGTIPNNKYVGYSYLERDLYRPGEIINFALIVRKYGNYEPLSSPVIVEITDPQGKSFATLKSATNNYGLASFSLNTTTSNFTGKYYLNFKVGNETIDTNYFFLEEFVPQRIQAIISTDEKRYFKGNEVNGTLQADYLFGAPASEQEYEILCKFMEANFQPKGYKDYRFGIDREKPIIIENPIIKGALDQNGTTKFQCKIDNIKQFKSPIKVNISGTVFEAGSGRTSKTESSVIMHPSNFYIGLKSSSNRFHPNTDITIHGVILDKNENILTNISSVKYNLYSIVYNYVRVYNSSSDNFTWQWSKVNIPVLKTQNVDVKNGRFSITFKPEDYWANYLVEVSDNDMITTSSITVYSWSYDYEEKKISNPEMLNITFDKEIVNFGDTVTASTLLPFAGKIIWATELDKVLDYKIENIASESASFKFTVPNNTSTLYVTAFLISSNEEYAIRRAFGVAKLHIKPKKHYLVATIEAPDKIKPNTNLKIKIKVKEPFVATIAIVDEGILQITKFKTPNAYDGIFKDIALSCSTAETFGWVMRKDAFSLPGGGEKIVLENIPTFTKLVSYWRGIVESDKKGVAEIDYKVPQYEGKLRIMLVALNENKITSAEKYVVVASNVSILPTIPRFAYYEDEINFPISFRNNLEKEISTSLNIDIIGATITKKYSNNISLKPKNSYVALIPIKVKSNVDNISIAITAKSGEETYYDSFIITVYPNKPITTEMNFLGLKNGRNDLSAHFIPWYNTKLKAKLVASPILGLSSLNHIKYLINYPYGCIEQTSSSLLTLIKIRNIVNLIDPEIADKAFLTNKIYAGIQRIISMQTVSGGFSYWPGSQNAEIWSSIYATLVLLEAKKAGFLVPEIELNSALEFIKAYAHKKMMAYYVLALGGKLDAKNVADLIVVSDNKNLNAEDLMFLAGALYYSGKENYAKEIFKRALETYIPTYRNLNDDFYSPMRVRALKLYFSEIMFPASINNEQYAIPLVQLLSKQSYYYSTQELAWSILSLGVRIQNVKYAKNYTAKLFINDTEAKYTQTKDTTIWDIKNFPKPIKNAAIDVSSDGIVYLYIEIKGFKKNAQFQRYANGIELTKQFLDFKGNPIYKFRQKDLILVKLSAKAYGRNNFANVAISDYLPAGFEIENPRLNPEVLPAWIDKKNLMSINYVDYRDERIDIFTTLNPNTSYFYYIVRATTSGDFFMLPAEATVMYQPEYRAKTDEAKIKIIDQ